MRDDHDDRFEVYKCVQLNRCSVVCGCVYIEGRGAVCFVDLV